MRSKGNRDEPSRGLPGWERRKPSLLCQGPAAVAENKTPKSPQCRKDYQSHTKASGAVLSMAHTCRMTSRVARSCHPWQASQGMLTVQVRGCRQSPLSCLDAAPSHDIGIGGLGGWHTTEWAHLNHRRSFIKTENKKDRSGPNRGSLQSEHGKPSLFCLRLSRDSREGDTNVTQTPTQLCRQKQD